MVQIRSKQAGGLGACGSSAAMALGVLDGVNLSKTRSGLH